MKPNVQLVGLRISRSILTLAVLISISLIFTVYTASAYYVASFVHEIEGRLWWPSMPGGTFFPWPRAPTGIQAMLMTLLNEVDSQYYRYIIKSGVLVALAILLWVIVLWRVWRMRGSHHPK